MSQPSPRKPKNRRKKGGGGFRDRDRYMYQPNCNKRSSVSATPGQRPTTRVVHVSVGDSSLPRLAITYTNEQRSIAKWLKEHVMVDEETANPVVKVLGLDTETKPCFTRQDALASKGPDVLQLACSDGNCIVIHLSQMKGLQALGTTLQRKVAELLDPKIEGEEPRVLGSLSGYLPLSSTLKSRHVIKAGVGIDDDALELHENKLLSVNCRLELRTIDAVLNKPNSAGNDDKKHPAKKQGTKGKNNAAKPSENNENQIPQSLKGLAEFYVPGLSLAKKKKLQMSNWELPLSDEQVGYAAADAFAGAIVVQTLVLSTDNQHTNSSFVESVLGKEIDIGCLRADRERKKKERKKEAEKRRQENKKQKAISKQDAGQAKNNAFPNASRHVEGGQQSGRSKKRKSQSPTQFGPDYPLNKQLRCRR